MKIFLSHNSTDKEAVSRIAQRLDDADNKYNVWFDKWNLVPGDPWQEELENAIEEASCVVVFLGKTLGPWHHEELRISLADRVKGKRRVVPVLLPGASRPSEREIPRFLQRLSWVEFEDIEDDIGFHYLCCGIEGKPPGRLVHP